MMQLLDTKRQQWGGHTLIELLVALGMLALLLPTLLSALAISFQSNDQLSQRQNAQELIINAQETLRTIRASGWAQVAQSGVFHPEYIGEQWQLVVGPETIGDFTRRITISSVLRNTAGAIVESGGVADPSTKKVTILVTWNTFPVQSLTSELYLTRYLDNISYEETTESDFQNGSFAGTVVQNTAGGEVVLASGGQGNWCNPFDAQVEQVDLPKQGVAKTISAKEGRVFAGTGENASGVSFAYVSVSDTNPPIATIIGTFDGYKTNNIFAEDNYAYIATDTNSEEVIILKVNQQPYRKDGYFNIPGNTDGIKVMTSGLVGYALANNKLWSFDLTSKSGSRPILDTDGITLANTATSLSITSNYALVTTDSSTTKLQIVDLANPTLLTALGTATFSSAKPVDVATNMGGTRAYVVTAHSATLPELFIIDITSKTGSLSVLGTYDTGEMSPSSVTVVPGNRVVIGGVGGEEYQVISVDTENAPVRCGGLEVPEGINDVDSVLEADGDAYSYVLTAVQNSELKIIQGGPGGQYSTTGSFESAPFDAGYSTAFNYVIASLTIPNPASTANFQVAVAQAVDSSCTTATYHFVGPDGTSETFFDDEGAVPLGNLGSGYENPARCFKYKVFLDTNDNSSTPIFNDFTVNYSP